MIIQATPGTSTSFMEEEYLITRYVRQLYSFLDKSSIQPEKNDFI